MAISMNNVSRNVLSATEKAMSKTDRRAFKENKAYAFVTIQRAKALKRWGNKCYFTLNTSSGALGRNSLVSAAWNCDEIKAWDKARKALDYFVEGDKNNYKINVVVIEKGDHPSWNWDAQIDQQAAEEILTEAFGTKTEVYGENFVLTQSPALRSLRWEDEDEIIEYDLDSLKSRHSGREEGCFFSDWE